MKFVDEDVVFLWSHHTVHFCSLLGNRYYE